MPCSVATYRARIGNFCPVFVTVNRNAKSIFKSSFLYYLARQVLNVLHPIMIVGSFIISFLVSLTVLAILLVIMFSFSAMCLHNFLFFTCPIIFCLKNRHHLLFHFFELSFFSLLRLLLRKICLLRLVPSNVTPAPTTILSLLPGMLTAC